jgi:hypothetical protein
MVADQVFFVASCAVLYDLFCNATRIRSIYWDMKLDLNTGLPSQSKLLYEHVTSFQGPYLAIIKSLADAQAPRGITGP